MGDQHLTRKQHERLSAIYLVSLHSSYRESILIGKISGDSLSEDLAGDVESLFYNYFYNKRESVPLRKPERCMTYEEIIDIIGDALDMIAIEATGFIEVDWNGQYRLKDMRGI